VRGREGEEEEEGRRERGEVKREEGQREKVERTHGRHRESKIPHKPKGVFEIVV
jgi:hypothetical protein